jgi:hypothetical protein
MKMTKFVMVVAFLIVLAAGAVVGMALDQHFRLNASVAPATPPHTRPSEPRFPKVSPEQHTKIEAIWKKVQDARDQRFVDRGALESKRWQDIQAIFTPAQKEQYDTIESNYRQDVKKVEQGLQDILHGAEDQTRALLTKDQQDQYDKFREWQRHNGRGGPGRGGPGRGGPGRGGPSRGNRDRMRPTSGPTSAPTGPLTNALEDAGDSSDNSFFPTFGPLRDKSSAGVF